MKCAPDVIALMYYVLGRGAYYRITRISKMFALYKDGPYIFTRPFFGRSKSSLPRLNTLSVTN